MSRAFRDILVGGAPSPDLCDCGSAALGNRHTTAYSSKDSGPSFGYNRTQEGPMTIITPEIRQAIEQAGEQPVQLTDPETNSVCIIVRADVYERVRASLYRPACATIDCQELAHDPWSVLPCTSSLLTTNQTFARRSGSHSRPWATPPRRPATRPVRS